MNEEEIKKAVDDYMFQRQQVLMKYSKRSLLKIVIGFERAYATAAINKKLKENNNGIGNSGNSNGSTSGNKE